MRFLELLRIKTIKNLEQDQFMHMRDKIVAILPFSGMAYLFRGSSIRKRFQHATRTLRSWLTIVEAHLQ